ncbi:Putative carbamoylphosphate synthase large subunit (modular protein) [Nitrosopumilaceae archaeon]|nr:Putative carbamoylphosphate synthase large subunit (modular protein) [Nitrosopumilaceae archaeon]
MRARSSGPGSGTPTTGPSRGYGTGPQGASRSSSTPRRRRGRTTAGSSLTSWRGSRGRCKLPRSESLGKILVLGSGAIKIGEAGESGLRAAANSTTPAASASRPSGRTASRASLSIRT